MDAFLLSLLDSPVTGWGAFGMLAILMAVSIWRGWVIPGRTHDRLMKLSNQRGDDWKGVAEDRATLLAALTKSLSIIEPFFQKISVKPKDGE